MMKNLIIAALAAGVSVFAVPATAQSVSGTIDLTGTVGAKCTAAGGLDASIDLGELALADGTVNSAFSANVGGLTRTFRVTCTSSNPQLSVDASPLVNAAIATPTAGYTNTVNYTATMVAAKAGGGIATVADTSNVAGATTVLVGDHLANAANNIAVRVSSGNTTAGALLEAGTYNGSIAITVAPSA